MKTYYILKPEMKETLKTLLDGRTLRAAMDYNISIWSFVMETGLDSGLGVYGKYRVRKKKLKALLKQTFIESFLECMEERQLTAEEAMTISGDTRLLSTNPNL